jgi:hypothetical protein
LGPVHHPDFARAWRRRVTRPTVLYDAECAFCRWSLAHLLRCDPHEKLRIVPLQEALDRALVAVQLGARRWAAVPQDPGEDAGVGGDDGDCFTTKEPP